MTRGFPTADSFVRVSPVPPSSLPADTYLCGMMFSLGFSLLVASISLSSLSLAFPYTSELSLVNAQTLQNGTISVPPFPPELSYEIRFNEQISIDTLQTECMILQVMQELALRAPYDNVEPQLFRTDEYPDVQIDVGCEHGQRLPAKFAVWLLNSILKELVTRRGDRFVVTGMAVFWRSRLIGALVIGPPSSQPTTIAGSQVNGTITAPAVELSSPMTSRNDVSSSDTFPFLGGAKVVNLAASNESTENDDLMVQMRMTAISIDQTSIYIDLCNAIVVLTIQAIDVNRGVQIRDTARRLEFLIEPPRPPRQTEPFNTVHSSIRVIARMGAYYEERRRWRELEATAILMRTWISSTKLMRLAH